MPRSLNQPFSLMQRPVYISMKWCWRVAFSKTSFIRIAACSSVSIPDSSNFWYRVSNFSTVNLFSTDFIFLTTFLSESSLRACCLAAHDNSEDWSLGKFSSGRRFEPVLEPFKSLSLDLWVFMAEARQSSSSLFCCRRFDSLASPASPRSSFGIRWFAGRSWQPDFSLNCSRNFIPYLCFSFVSSADERILCGMLAGQLPSLYGAFDIILKKVTV
mmetsp:Transcript_85434/g.153818  ORF Transcript_85434/g.153818 Transcript_85434/m.153818 type:complete len:215 (+) Transcript_85434:1518-2162(+)